MDQHHWYSEEEIFLSLKLFEYERDVKNFFWKNDTLVNNTFKPAEFFFFLYKRRRVFYSFESSSNEQRRSK